MCTFSQYIRVIVFLGLFQVSQVHTGWNSLIDGVKSNPESTAKVVGRAATLLSLGLLTLYAGKSIYEACEAYALHRINQEKMARFKDVRLVKESELAKRRDTFCSRDTHCARNYLEEAKQKGVEAFVSVLGAVGSYALLKQLG